LAAQTSARGKRESAVVHSVGIVLAVAALGMLAAAMVESIDRGTHADELAFSGLIVGGIGLALRSFAVAPVRLPTAALFRAALASWIALTLASALVYQWTGTFSNFGDSLFESVSGVTTTGATVLHPIEGTPAGVLFWRSTTQWFGGMGVLALAVTVLPLLDVGGLETSAAAPGAEGRHRDPRGRPIFRNVLALYGILTVLVVVGYLAAGMSLFDAVNHSFTTVSTGGFSTHDQSFAFFDSAAVEWVAIAGMLVAGASFALLWQALRGRPGSLFRSTAVHTYVGVVAGTALVAILSNRVTSGLDVGAVRSELFTVVSLTTTTGYRLLDYTTWSFSLQAILLFGIAIGGMSGSTAGGFKATRLVAITSYAWRELARSLHSALVRPTRVGQTALDEDLASRIMGFTVLFLGVILAGTIGIAAFDADVVTALSAATTSIANAGPGLGAVGPTETYRNLEPGGRAIAAFVMLLGRLEIFPVLLGLAGATGWQRARADRRREHPARELP